MDFTKGPYTKSFDKNTKAPNICNQLQQQYTQAFYL